MLTLLQLFPAQLVMRLFYVGPSGSTGLGHPSTTYFSLPLTVTHLNITERTRTSVVCSLFDRGLGSICKYRLGRFNWVNSRYNSLHLPPHYHRSLRLFATRVGLELGVSLRDQETDIVPRRTGNQGCHLLFFSLRSLPKLPIFSLYVADIDSNGE